MWLWFLHWQTHFGWHNPPQCTQGGFSSRILLPFVLCKDLWLSWETPTWFSQHDGSFLLATWPSYTPSDTLWVSWQSLRPGQQFHLLPETSLCCLWHLISLRKVSMGVPNDLNILGLPCVRLFFSPLWIWKTTKLSFHQTLEEVNAQLK